MCQRSCNSSCLVQDLLLSNLYMNVLILKILSAGRRASILTESRITPRYSKHVHGPTVLFVDRGIPKLSNNFSYSGM